MDGVNFTVTNNKCWRNYEREREREERNCLSLKKDARVKFTQRILIFIDGWIERNVNTASPPIHDVSFKFVAQVHTVASPLIEYE